jgi:hypothetical protein
MCSLASGMANMVSNSEISGGETIVGGLLVPIHATTLCAFVRAPLRSNGLDDAPSHHQVRGALPPSKAA